MFSTITTFIGVDPTAGEKPMVYAAIDQRKQMLALGEGSLDDVLAFAAGQRRAVIGVCAPRRPNTGLMHDPNYREKLTPVPGPGRWENARTAEYLLRQRNIFIPPTPASEEECPNWMKMGFRFFKRLVEMGYQEIAESPAERICLEIYPHAAFSALLGIIPFQKHTFEGRVQRQLVLFECQLDLPDPMELFNEITRHRLLNGVLSIDSLYKPGELDAIVAAYTSMLAAIEPDAVCRIGDALEGQIVIPVKEMKTIY